MRLPFLTAALALAALLPAAHGEDAPFQRDARPPVDLHAQKTLYVVPYAHLDTQWRWTYPQVIREFLADTLHKNFELLDKYPNYVFNFSGSRRYEMMREYYPEDWERLKGYVKAGRWFPCGSSVDEADANVPSLEALVRHTLYGNRYFRREFGQASEEFMLPDCFGFPASLPSVLAHCGIKGFSTQKLTWHSAVGIPFKVGEWTGPDGRGVLAALDPGSYGGGVTEDLSQSQSWLKRIEHTGEGSGLFADYHYYGTGDRGGSPDEESVKWMERSIAGRGPLRVVSSRAEQMFLDLPPDAPGKLPHYQGDLLLIEHSAGSLTSEAYMKRWNRKNERLADAAERAAVAAAWLGGSPYPAKKLYDSWDLTLGSQMHDMLPGTSLPRAYEYCWNDDLLAANGFAAVAEDSAGAVAAAMDTQARGTPVVVYNPLSTAREDVAEASLPGGEEVKSVRVLGPDGREVPAQITRRTGGRVDFAFLASVGPVSFTTFDAAAVADAAPAPSADAPRATERGLENARYRVAVNAAGDVASIYDKTARRELLAAPVRLEFHQENPQQFPAWNMDWADRQRPAHGFVDGPATVRVVEAGPVRATLEIERRAQGSRFVSRVSLAAGGAGDSVEFRDQIDWGTREASLKAAFPLTVENPQAAYEDKIGVTMRGGNGPTQYEVPQQEWLDLTDRGGEYGVSILNDCKYGSDKPDDHTVRLTLLYTPGVRGDYQDQACQDFGRHDMAYAVAGHPGGWQQGGATLRARRLNQPLCAFLPPAHPGALGRAFSLAALDNPQVEIVALKQAEDSGEVIVRLRELAGQGAQAARLALAAPVLAAREVDGQERPLPRTAPALQDGRLAVQMAPYSVRAFALKLAPPPAPAAPPAATALDLPFDEDAVSTRANRADGGFDKEGRTFPAEMLPAQVVSEGVPLRLGPTADGQKNALACRGQTLPLPGGEHDRLVLLAAAAEVGDPAVDFHVRGAGGADAVTRLTVQDWSGYLGQWDTRQWVGEQPELTYAWHNPLDGLLPGFVKPATVAWFASHRHERGGAEVYKYCYLYKYEIALPPGATQLVLPDAPGVRLFAAAVVNGGHAPAPAARPLFDTLADHRPDAPAGFQPAAGSYNDSIQVAVAEPLYRVGGGLRYTLDGSEPTEQSPRYAGPLYLHATATLKARMFLPGVPGGGPVAEARYEIVDRTPPALRSASASTLLPEVRAEFSEPLDRAAAESPARYRLEPPDAAVQAVHCAEDGLTVRLTLAAPLPAGSRHRLVVEGVCDQSPARNAAGPLAGEIRLAAPAFHLPGTVACDGTQTRAIPAPGLPVAAGDAWTLNFFARADQPPDNRTLIAGFGQAKNAVGQARYLSKFANGLHFWSGDRDVETQAPLDLHRWQMLTATYDGHTLRVYKDAQPVGEAAVELAADQSVVNIAPVDPWDQRRRFRGEVRELSVWNEALPPASLAALLAQIPPAPGGGVHASR